MKAKENGHIKLAEIGHMKLNRNGHTTDDLFWWPTSKAFSRFRYACGRPSEHATSTCDRFCSNSRVRFCTKSRARFWATLRTRFGPLYTCPFLLNFLKKTNLRKRFLGLVHKKRARTFAQKAVRGFANKCVHNTCTRLPGLPRRSGP